MTKPNILISLLTILSFLTQGVEASCLSRVESRNALRPMANSVAIENSRVYYKDTGQKALNTPHRLTIDECRQRLIENLRAIKALYPSLQKEFTKGLQLLESEGIDAFEDRAYPKIIKAADSIKLQVESVSSLPAIFGFNEPEIRNKLEEFLRQIASEADADKILIWFFDSQTCDFTYTVGFSHEELINFQLNIHDILEAIADQSIRSKKEEKIKKSTEALRRCGMISALEVSPDTDKWLHTDDNYISIVIGRSQEYAQKYGELTEEDRKTLKDKLGAFIDDKSAPWWGVRDFLRDNGYSDFDLFMMVLRHNGGVDIFKVSIFPFIYNDLKYTINKIKVDDEESRKWHDALINSLERMAKLTRVIDEIDIFLDILENGTDFKTRNITQYMRNRVELFRQEAMAKGLTFALELSNEDLIVPHCDLNLIGVLVDNLIQNAIKYTDKGSVTVRLSREIKKSKYGSHEEQDCAVFEVEDTGIGIPKDDKYKIFNRGFRADNVGEIQGTGIGLGAVGPIAYIMRGDINVESELDKGTKITISIPLVSSEEILDSSVSTNVNSPFVIAPIKEHKTSLAILHAA